ncbi:hypothetical protein L605_001600000050 [Bacillus subtilis J26]|nr:hypothetical protein L607_001600000230 [Bacillus subtilis J24]TWG76106.1 hypothetical protein L605_001600000050 [Bacillus subtilis J26]
MNFKYFIGKVSQINLILFIISVLFLAIDLVCKSYNLFNKVIFNFFILREIISFMISLIIYKAFFKVENRYKD